MLGHGEWHRSIPRDPVKNVRMRAALNRDCLSDPHLRADIINVCRQDILAYINLFVWQFNPKRKQERVGPFITWDFQEAALLDRPETTGRKGILWCYEHDRTAVVEKSREMGASWLFLILEDWLGIFHEHVQCLNVSKSAEAVDSKSPDSLFWKLRFMHERLPQWLRGEIEDTKMFMGYRRSRSSATGEASTGRAGVGGRASVIFVDEFSQIKEDREVRQRTANTSDCRFFNGTHLGTGTEFFTLTQSPEIVKIVMHWTQHPRKNKGMYSYDREYKKLRFWEHVPGEGLAELRGPNVAYPPEFEFIMDGSPTGGPFPGIRSPWYDAKCLDIGTTRAVAMELDIDPKGSVSTPFDPLLIHQLKQYCRPPSWEGDLEYTEHGEPVKLVPVAGGPIKLWCTLVNGKPPTSVYGMGVDVSAGTGNSPSTMSVVDGRTGQKVMQYANAHIQPDVYGVFGAAICRLFADEHGGGAKVCWEAAGGPGVSFGKTLMGQCGYRHVSRYTLQPDRHPHRRQSAGTEAPGWRPTGASKNIILTQYMIALRNREMLNLDEEALEDTLSFRYDTSGNMVHSKDCGRDPEAARENHGDLVMADAQAWKMVDELNQLVSRQPDSKPELPPEDNVLTYKGRQALHERRRREEVWQ